MQLWRWEFDWRKKVNWWENGQRHLQSHVVISFHALLHGVKTGSNCSGHKEKPLHATTVWQMDERSRYVVRRDCWWGQTFWMKRCGKQDKAKLAGIVQLMVLHFEVYQPLNMVGAWRLTLTVALLLHRSCRWVWRLHWIVYNCIPILCAHTWQSEFDVCSCHSPWQNPLAPGTFPVTPMFGSS